MPVDLPLGFSNYPDDLKLRILELIIKNPLIAEDLSFKPLLSEAAIAFIYDSKEYISQNSEKAVEFKNYILSTVESLHNKLASKGSYSISPEGVINFLSATSGYLFDKASDALNYLEVNEKFQHLLDARKDKTIQQSALEITLNLVIDGTFKAATSGIMNATSLQECAEIAIKEAVSRAKFSTLGVAVSTLIANTTSLETSYLKQPIRAAAKTLSRGGDAIGATVSALTSTVTSNLPKYTSEVITHGAIGGAIGYMKTGDMSGITTGALQGAVTRGVYQYGFELLDGKTHLNKAKFLQAGAARIASKIVANTITESFPIASVVAVAGLAIAENVSAYLENSANPEIASAKDAIDNTILELKSSELSHLHSSRTIQQKDLINSLTKHQTKQSNFFQERITKLLKQSQKNTSFDARLHKR